MPRLPRAARLALSLLALVPLSSALDDWSSRGGSTAIPSKPLPPVQKKQPLVPGRPRRTFSASEFVFVDPKPEPQRGLSLFNLRASKAKVEKAKFRQKLAIIAQAGAGTALIVAFERAIWAIGAYSGVKIPSAPVKTFQGISSPVPGSLACTAIIVACERSMDSAHRRV